MAESSERTTFVKMENTGIKTGGDKSKMCLVVDNAIKSRCKTRCSTGTAGGGCPRQESWQVQDRRTDEQQGEWERKSTVLEVQLATCRGTKHQHKLTFKRQPLMGMWMETGTRTPTSSPPKRCGQWDQRR